MNISEAQKSVLTRAQNGEFVKRARAGDQNAMATIEQIGVMAKRGDLFFQAARSAIDDYIRKNPAPGFGEEAPLTSSIVRRFREEAADFGAFRPAPRSPPKPAPKRPAPKAAPRVAPRVQLRPAPPKPKAVPKISLRGGFAPKVTPPKITLRGAVKTTPKKSPIPITLHSTAPKDDMQKENAATSAVQSPTAAAASVGPASLSPDTLGAQLSAPATYIAPPTGQYIAPPTGQYQGGGGGGGGDSGGGYSQSDGGPDDESSTDETTETTEVHYAVPDDGSSPDDDSSTPDDGSYAPPTDDSGDSSEMPTDIVQEAPTDDSAYEESPEDESEPSDPDDTGEVATDVSGDYGCDYGEDATTPPGQDFVNSLNRVCSCIGGSMVVAVILADGPSVAELIRGMASQLSPPNQSVLMHGVRRPDAHPRGSLHRVGQALGKAHRLQIVRNGAPLRALSPAVGWELGE